MNVDNESIEQKSTDLLSPIQMLMGLLDRFPAFEGESVEHLRKFEGEIIVFKRKLQVIKESEKVRDHSIIERLHDDSRYFGYCKETETDEAAVAHLDMVYDKMHRLNMLRETELQKLSVIHESLLSELIEVGRLNQDLVIPEMEKLQFEISSIQQDVSYYEKEVEQTEKVLLLLENEIHNSRSNLHDIQSMNQEKVNERISTSTKSHLARESIDHIQRDLESLHEHLSEIKESNSSTEFSISNAIALIGEDANNVFSLSREKEKINLVFEVKDDSLRKLQRQLDISKLDRGKVVTSRLQLELDLKKVQDDEKSTRRAKTLGVKQLEGLTKVLERKRLLADSDTRMISQMILKMDECERSLALQKSCNESIMKQADKLKALIANKVLKFSNQNSCCEDLRFRLEKALRTVHDVELELNTVTIEIHKSDKVLSLISAHMEIIDRRAAAFFENEVEVKEQIKIKNLILADLKCTKQYLSRQLADVMALHLTLKNEKDIITAAREASSERIMSCVKDLNLANGQLETLVNDYKQKSCILLKQQDSHENSRVLRATFQTEKASVYLHLREKKEESNRCLLKIKNLRDSAINLRREILMQHSRKHSLVSANQLLSKKLREMSGEILRSHQRANLQDRSIKEAELSARQRKENIRFLSLKRSDLSHTLALRMKSISDRAELDKSVLALHASIRHELYQQDKIIKQLEDPDHSLRNKEMTDEDPDNYQLDKNISSIQKNVHENRGRLFQKRLTRDDIIVQVENMETEIRERMDHSKPLMEKLNRTKIAIREITRRILALVGELTMSKMLSLNLEAERLNHLQTAGSLDYDDLLENQNSKFWISEILSS